MTVLLFYIRYIIHRALCGWMFLGWFLMVVRAITEYRDGSKWNWKVAKQPSDDVINLAVNLKMIYLSFWKMFFVPVADLG